MSNVLLALVSVFISLGLSSGYIAPTGVTEVTNTSVSLPNVSYENSSPSIFKNVGEINETEIYEIVEDKASNLSERSLIFINKKLKTLRRIPFRNKYQGYQPFMSQPGLSAYRWMIDEKFPQKFVKEQHSDIVKAIQRQLFDPNVEIEKPQEQAVYRYVYPDVPKRNESSMYDDRQDIKPHNNETKSPIDIKIDAKYVAKPPLKVLEMKTLDLYKNNRKFTTKGSISSVAPEQYSKNMVIKSYTNRKPKSNGQNCGFLKPNWLHRMTFNKDIEEKINPIDVTNADGKVNSFTEDKLDRYIKQALSELQTQIQKSDEIDNGKNNKSMPKDNEDNEIDTGNQKLDELIAQIGET